MKKTLVVLAVLLAALMTVSAADIAIVAGAAAGFGINSISYKGDVDNKTSENDLVIGAFGEAYFTDDLAAYAEVAMNAPVSLKTKVGSVETDLSDNAKSSVAFAAGAAYKYNIQKGLDLIAKAGVSVSSTKSATEVLNTKTTTKSSLFGLQLSVAGRYLLDKKSGISLEGGLKANVILGGNYKIVTKVGSNDPSTTNKDVNVSGFGIQPFFGATMAF